MKQKKVKIEKLECVYIVIMFLFRFLITLLRVFNNLNYIYKVLFYIYKVNNKLKISVFDKLYYSYNKYIVSLTLSLFY